MIVSLLPNEDDLLKLFSLENRIRLENINSLSTKVTDLKNHNLMFFSAEDQLKTKLEYGNSSTT